MSQAGALNNSGGGAGTVTSFSFVNANGFTGTVTNATTTPALTLTAAPAGPYHSLAPYIVGTDAFSTYATIQAAVNAANGTGLYSHNNEIDIFIKAKGAPYIEDVTLYDGINLVSFDPCFYPDVSQLYSTQNAVVIQGQLISTGGFGTSNKIVNIGLKQDTASFVDFAANASFSNIVFNGCFFFPGYNGNPTPLMSNSGGGNTCIIVMSNCNFDDDKGGSNSVICTDAGINGGQANLSLNNSYFNLDGTTTVAAAFINITCHHSTIKFKYVGSAAAIIDILATYSKCSFSTFTAVNADASSFGEFDTCTVNAAFDLSGAAPTNLSYVFSNCDFTSFSFLGVTFTGNSTPNLTDCVGVCGYNRVTTPPGDYTTLITDNFVAADSNDPRSITLFPTPFPGMTQIVKDISGLANVNNITIHGNGFTIDGAATYVINTAFGSVTLVFNGGEWSKLL